MSEAAMSSFTWKRPRDLETQQGRETPQDPVTRYEGADIEPASIAAWRLLMEQLRGRFSKKAYDVEKTVLLGSCVRISWQRDVRGHFGHGPH
jgi:hypothetical protein